VGGSGGGGYFSGDPFKARRALAAQDATRDEFYEASCNNALQELLGGLNNRDVDAIATHLGEIKRAIEDELDGTIDLRFGGSVAKHTYVDGLSDVDSLVLLDKCELAAGPPSAAKKFLATRLEEELVGASISTGALAVTVRFPDAEVQLLPAVSCEGAVQIADSGSDQWARIRPRDFSRVLSQVNEEKGRKVVPVIKLAKAIIANFPESTKLTGYHAESLAVAAFRSYAGPLTHKTMLRFFFERGASLVRSPIKDRTGQSVHVDDYLGGEGSLERRIVSDYFARISRRMALADSAQSVDQWKRLFED
jgi:hypothetical protein